MAIKIQNTTVIDDNRNLVNITNANTQDLSIGGVQVTASVTELNYIDGINTETSLQNQIDSVNVELGTLTKSFANNETATITLSNSISPAPIVSVTKEIPIEANISSKGAWDVLSNGSNYDRHDTAYDTTLTLSDASANGTFTLSSGSFANTDIGKIITDGTGEAYLKTTNGEYTLISSFSSTGPFTSGNWSMFALDFNADNGLEISGYSEVAEGSGTAGTSDIFNDSSDVALYQLDANGLDSSTNNYDLNMYAPEYSVTSKFGTRSLYIPDGDDTTYGEIGGIDLSNNNGSYSLSAWFRLDLVRTGFSGSHFIAGIGSSSDTADLFKMNIGVVNGQIISGDDGTFQPIIASGVTATTDTWIHTVVTYDGALNESKIYVNGSLANTISSSHMSLGTPSQASLLIGQEPDQGPYPFGGFSPSQCTAGYVDQVRILNKAISDNEALLLYNETGTILRYQPIDQYLPAITNISGQISTSLWNDINSMTADDVDNEGSVFYAISNDDHTTWSIARASDGVRPIVRNNSDTWEYNSNETYGSTTWTTATVNGELDALQEALTNVAANRMNKIQLDAVADGSHFTLNDTLDLMIALYLPSNGASPTSDAVTINYDANAYYKLAVIGTDYNFDFPANNVVRITSNAAQNLKVKVL